MTMVWVRAAHLIVLHPDKLGSPLRKMQDFAWKQPPGASVPCMLAVLFLWLLTDAVSHRLASLDEEDAGSSSHISVSA